MLEGNYSTTRVTTRGSKVLKSKLQRGDIKRIADVFGVPHSKAFSVIEGKYASEDKIVACAEQLARFYEEVDLENKRNKILESYERINKN